MTNNFNIEVPINPTSLGQIGYGILTELFHRNINPNIFIQGHGVDLKAFLIEDGFVEWLQECISKASENFSDDQTTLSLWHINGSQKRLTKRSVLWTFHETDQLTGTEVNILKNYDKILVSSEFSKQVFSKYLQNKVDICYPFFDDLHFYRTNREYLDKDVISYCLIGKSEKRKHTIDTIVTWAEKFGNNSKFRLNCCIFNPFIPIEEQTNELLAAFKGRVPLNINILPYQDTNTMVNSLMNACDVHISMSGAEGWSLPIFNALCLGKQVIASNDHAHKEFVSINNSILVEAGDKIDLIDNRFFVKGGQFNQGSFSSFNKNGFLNALDKSIPIAKERNVEGEKLKEKFSLPKTVDKLLSYV